MSSAAVGAAVEKSCDEIDTNHARPARVLSNDLIYSEHDKESTVNVCMIFTKPVTWSIKGAARFKNEMLGNTLTAKRHGGPPLHHVVEEQQQQQLQRQKALREDGVILDADGQRK